MMSLVETSLKQFISSSQSRFSHVFTLFCFYFMALKLFSDGVFTCVTRHPQTAHCFDHMVDTALTHTIVSRLVNENISRRILLTSRVDLCVGCTFGTWGSFLVDWRRLRAIGKNKNVYSVRLANSDSYRVLVSLASKERMYDFLTHRLLL